MYYNPAYINTRVAESPYGGWLVQGQSGKSYNWETIRKYPETQKSVAEVVAKNLARKYSERVSGLVTAYNSGGYGIAGFVNGVTYK